MDSCEAEDQEVKDLIKRKTRLAKDPARLNELGDILYRLGHLYYQKGYYNEALDEFESALSVRQKLTSSLDTATTHRFIGETLDKIGSDFERAKSELDKYHSITLRLNDPVELQRSHTTLGNHFMTLAENNYQKKRDEHLNQAYSHYLKSYEILDVIHEKKLTDPKEFDLMKARTCLNCAFVMDEKRNLIVCNEYLRTAIEICEANHFYEDLIRCYYIKCDHAKRKGKTEESLKVADKIIEITKKTKDFVQQSADFFSVAEMYMKVQNFEKAKILLKKAYQLRKKCLINPEITKKLKDVLSILRLQKELLVLRESGSNSSSTEVNGKMYKINEQLGDLYCNLALYELGLESYKKQLEMCKTMNIGKSELATIYSSIAQTYQDLNKYPEALKYFELELKTFCSDDETEAKSLMNIAQLKEKLNVEFEDIEAVYHKAYEKAKGNIDLQIKVYKCLRDSQIAYGLGTNDTTKKINSLNEIKRIRDPEGKTSSSEDDENSRESSEDNQDNESIVFSSDSEDEAIMNNDDDEGLSVASKPRQSSKASNKKYTVKRNLRGETALHVACIKGNLKLAKKLVEEGHPVNERDNLNWLPIHEACNYGHLELVELLIRYGAKVNDLIGPITPLHDASQNGHLAVVKALLKAGALPYVFTKEGYTPLDFLCKYKEDNEKNLSGDDLALYKECYDLMIESIRGKDKSYKIKRVVLEEDNIVVEDESNDAHSDSERPQVKSKRPINQDLILPDEEDDDDDTAGEAIAGGRKKKKNAIKEYKAALSSIGSKAGTGHSLSSASHGKKVVDKVLITEDDYSTSENWLINDLSDKKNKKQSYYTSGMSVGSNKRKHRADDQENEENCDEDDDFAQAFRRNKNKENRMETIDSSSSEDLTSSNTFRSKSKSKKRIIDSNVNDENEPLNRMECSDVIETDRIGPIHSPFKSTENTSSKSKPRQVKITKMLEPSGVKKTSSDNIERSSMIQDTSMPISESDLRRLNISNASNSSLNSINSNSIGNQMNSTVKIRAVIGTLNLCVPVADANSITVNDLTKQILSRYKAMFYQNDPTYREPEKVLLKSSDDMILFDQDYIKDVLDLSDSKCSVHVVIESVKEAPSSSDIYEELCVRTQSGMAHENLKKELKQSQETCSINLSGSFCASSMKHFELVVEAVKLSNKTSPDYLKKLIKIDLDSNYLGDQMVCAIIESVVAECSVIKVLNLSNNSISNKTLKTFSELASNSSRFRSLEVLNLNGNDFDASTVELATVLSNIVSNLPSLRELYMSDCKLEVSDQLDNGWLSFFQSIKSNSNLTTLDFSFNKFGKLFISQMIDTLPTNRIEYFNISNSYFSGETWPEVQLAHFLSHSLRYLSLRSLNYTVQQTSSLLINLATSCKQLKSLDISYNSFEMSSIKFLFNECLRLEEAWLINSITSDEQNDWLDVLMAKFDDNSVQPLNRLEIRANGCIINSIKSLFERKWPKSALNILFNGENVVEFQAI